MLPEQADQALQAALSGEVKEGGSTPNSAAHATKSTTPGVRTLFRNVGAGSAGGLLSRGRGDGVRGAGDRAQRGRTAPVTSTSVVSMRLTRRAGTVGLIKKAAAQDCASSDSALRDLPDLRHEAGDPGPRHRAGLGRTPTPENRLHLRTFPKEQPPKSLNVSRGRRVHGGRGSRGMMSHPLALLLRMP